MSKGAASEGDAHAAFNFSATLECPGCQEKYLSKNETGVQFVLEKHSSKSMSDPVVQFFSSAATMATPSLPLCTSSIEGMGLLQEVLLMEWPLSGN